MLDLDQPPAILVRYEALRDSVLGSCEVAVPRAAGYRLRSSTRRVADTIGSMPEVAFVMSAGQHYPLRELAGTLQYELELQGVPSSLHLGRFPEVRPNLVYVLLDPGELRRGSRVSRRCPDDRHSPANDLPMR